MLYIQFTHLVRAHWTSGRSATLGCLSPVLALGTHSISQLQTKGLADKKTSGCACAVVSPEEEEEKGGDNEINGNVAN